MFFVFYSFNKFYEYNVLNCEYLFIYYFQSQSHSSETGNSAGVQHKCNLSSNCDATEYDVMATAGQRKSEARRLSDSNNQPSLKYHQHPHQYHTHSHSMQPYQHQLVRRPSIDITATLGAGGTGSVSTRHGSVSSTGSGSDHHHQASHSIPSGSGGFSTAISCKRRRVMGGNSNGNSSTLISSASNVLSGGVSNSIGCGNGGSIGGGTVSDDYQQHSSRSRGHPLHSHHSHDVSGGESADGSRPGTPLCDERPEVLPSDPRRPPRECRHEPMILPLPKFGIQFFHQHRNSLAGQTNSNATSHTSINIGGYHHSSCGMLSSSSMAGCSSNIGAHILPNTNVSSSSHSSHSALPTTPTSTVSSGSSNVPGYPSHSPSNRYSSHWRSHQNHHHQQHSHGHSHPAHTHYNQTASGAAGASMVSPLRPRSLSSNSSDSDAPGQLSGSPSLEERIRTLDEMYERWSGGGGNSGNGGSNVPNATVNAVKRHDFASQGGPTAFRHTHRSGEHHSGANSLASSTSSRYKFPDIDVCDLKPSEIVKSVLAKKSIFDDDLQRLKKNQWYEPISDTTQLAKQLIGVCTSPGLPNLAATKSPVVGYTSTNSGNTALNKPSGALLQRLSSLSPMNSPQASISPYNSPSPSPSVSGSMTTTLTSYPIKVSTTTAASCISTTLSTTSATNISTVASASSLAAAMKGLQYPFPSHPPLPSTAAPLPAVQPAPPTGPAPSDPPQPKSSQVTTSDTSTLGLSSTRVKTNSIMKSLSVPWAAFNNDNVRKTDSRILIKSVSVPGSTNVGTIKSLNTHTASNEAGSHALSRSSLSIAITKTDEEMSKVPKQSSNSLSAISKKNERTSHKYNHRNENEKRSGRCDRVTERRKNSTNSQHSGASTSTPRVEGDSSENEENDRDMGEKGRRLEGDRDDRELEKDRDKEKPHKEREKDRDKEQKRLERERREREIRKQKEDHEARERKESEEREFKEAEDCQHRELEERERERVLLREREQKQREREQFEREERERKEQKEHEERLENERKEKEDRERVEQAPRELKANKELPGKHERGREDVEHNDMEREDQEIHREHSLSKPESTDKVNEDLSHTLNKNQSESVVIRQINDADFQNNKENAIDEPKSPTTVETLSKHRGRKSSHNSPIRLPKRRLSSQDSNNGNIGSHNSVSEDPVKRLRIETQHTLTASCAVKANERQHQKETSHGSDHTTKHSSIKHQNQRTASHTITGNIGTSDSAVSSAEKLKIKEHSNKHRTSKHHRHQLQQHQGNTKDISKGECEDNNTSASTASTSATVLPIVVVPSADKVNHHENISDQELESSTVHYLSRNSLNSSGDEGMSLQQSRSITSGSGQHKQRDHSGHHVRHKNKRDHRERKRPSTTESLTSATSNHLTDEELTHNQIRRTSVAGSHSGELKMPIQKCKQESRRSSERKSSRCSDEGLALTQSYSAHHRQGNNVKATPSRRVITSSGDSDDSDDPTNGGKKHSIFDIPDEGPYVSMYDKVKARSCKNMQKHEEEKKIKAKFTQLKQSRAKREEKKRSTSYEGDSDSDFDDRNQRSGGSSSYKSRNQNNLTSSSDDDDPTNMATRRRSSQASSHPHRMFSDSDSTTTAEAEARRNKLHHKLMRLCDDDGDDSSGDEIHTNARKSMASSPGKRSSSKRNSHSTRIASDSESQSQPAKEIKIKRELTDEEDCDNKFQMQIKSEILPSETTAESDDVKPKEPFIKTEGESIAASIEIKKEYKNFTNSSMIENPDYELALEHSASKSSLKIQQQCSPESRKRHKKSKKRQKNNLPMPNAPTTHSIVEAKNVLVTLTPSSFQIVNFMSTPESKVKPLLSPSYDPFDELKRECSSLSTTINHANNGANDLSVCEKKRHKERKEKKREKMRNMSDGGGSIDSDKLSKEERHRLKRSKKSKSLDTTRMISSAGSTVKANLEASSLTVSVAVTQPISTTSLVVTAATPVTQTGNLQTTTSKRGEKMEDIFGPISDEESQFTDAEGKELSSNFSVDTNYGGLLTSSSSITGPVVSAALNPYKQDPLTPKSHTVEENEENKQKALLPIGDGGAPIDRERHRKEKRERRRKEREKSRELHALSALQPQEQHHIDDENSVDLDEAGRALEAQLMEDSDNKPTEDATPSTATTYRSDMTDVFRFSDGDENSLDSNIPRIDKSDVHESNFTIHKQSLGVTTSTSAATPIHMKNKEKKKKKKRSKEERHHHQRRESSASVSSIQHHLQPQELQQQLPPQIAPSQSQHSVMSPPTKLSIDILAANAKQMHNLESQMNKDESGENSVAITHSPICKPSPSLPCLTDDDIDLGVSTIIQPTKSTNDMLTLSPMREKKLISPIPNTPTTNSTPFVNDKSQSIAYDPTTSPASLLTSATAAVSSTPTATNTPDMTSLATASTESNCASSTLGTPTTTKKKPEIFIPGFDGKLDEQISESAVKSISVEFNSSILNSNVDEPKIPVESPPDLLPKHMDKTEDSKSRVTISQEETESAVSALLGESFGNSTNIDYSFQEDTLEDDLAVVDSVNVEAECPEPDEEAAIAAKAIETTIEPLQPEEDAEEVNKAVQSLSTEEMDVKVDTPQSERGLQIDTDTEENADEADSSGASLKIDESVISGDVLDELADKESKCPEHPSYKISINL